MSGGEGVLFIDIRIGSWLLVSSRLHSALPIHTYGMLCLPCAGLIAAAAAHQCTALYRCSADVIIKMLGLDVCADTIVVRPPPPAPLACFGIQPNA